MKDHNLLTSTVMLETMWETRGQDLLDLISPFVFYAAAKVCVPQQIVDLQKILSVIKQEFGYVDMPIAVIDHVFKRNPAFFRKNHGAYYLKNVMDDVISEIEKRRDDCERKIQIISTQLAEYLASNVKPSMIVTPDYAIQELQGFFSRQGIFFGTNQLEEQESKIKNWKTDYYIAKYLYEKRDKQEIEFEYVIDLVKGYFLQTAIYLQAENGNISTATYKNVSFYYDTPFLLRLLGFKTSEDEKTAVELHQALSKQRANFYFFPQTQSEIGGILSRYQRGLKRNSYTLEGLDEKKYTATSVDRLKKTWESKLQSVFNTKLAQQLEYPKKFDGNIDERFSINKTELAEILKKNINYNAEEAMDADLESVIGIQELRGNVFSEEIEHCRAVFVTTNSLLAKTVNRYYRENVNDKAFPLVITDSDLAALTWIKCGSVGNLPERQLLRNAYMAMQPAPEMLEKFGNVLDQMQTEGKITPEIAIILRSSGFAKKEIMFASFEGEDGINESLVSEIETKLRQESSAAAREDERQKAERQRQEEQHDRIANACRQARIKATEAMNKKLIFWKRVLLSMEIVFILAAIVGMIYTIVCIQTSHIIVTILLIIFAAITACGIVDACKEREKRLYGWLVRQANKVYDREYDRLSEEYMTIAKGNNELQLDDKAQS